jgi:glycine oxidase
VKHYDTIIIGGGVIGLSLALELRKTGISVLIVEKGEPGREASWAAGGMLVDFSGETPPGLRKLATASSRMYPEFVHELEDESGVKIDLRSVGTLLFACEGTRHSPATTQSPQGLSLQSSQSFLVPASLWELEPALRVPDGSGPHMTALYIKESSVDPRHLTAAALAAARHRGIDFSSGDHVLAVEVADGKASGIRTNKTRFAAGMVVNCAGAWAGQIGPHPFPTRPVKGQMLCVAMPEKELVRHVVRTPEVYLIPRSDGRMLIGATVEEAGFDKQTVPETILKLRQAALDLVPKLADARILEAWAGLRPGTPDGLPILGATPTPGYFVATGHFRDGILLAPVTAKVMGQMMTGQEPQIDMSKLSANRFAD